MMRAIDEVSSEKSKEHMAQQNFNLAELFATADLAVNNLENTDLEKVVEDVFVPIKSGDKRILIDGVNASEVMFKDEHSNKRLQRILRMSNFSTRDDYEYIILFSESIYVKQVKLSVSSQYKNYNIGICLLRNNGDPLNKQNLSSNEQYNDGSRDFVYMPNSLVYGFAFNIPVKFDSAMVIFPLNKVTFQGINSLLESHKNLIEITQTMKTSFLNAAKASQEILRSREVHLDQVSNQYESLILERDRVVQFVGQNEGLLSKAKIDLEHLREEANDERKKFDALIIQVSEAKKAFGKQKESFDELTRNVEGYESLKSSNDTKQAEAEKRLQETEDKVIKAIAKSDTYTLDLDGHLEECGRQLKRYSLYSLTLIAFLATIFWWLTSSAVEMVQMFNSAPDTRIGQLLLSRLPLITATTLIIGTVSVVLYFFVNHIISLNKDRMNMLKASILAEQVSVALANEHSLSPVQRKEESKKIKIELMMRLFENKGESSKSEAKEVLTLVQLAEILSKAKSGI